MSYLEYNSGFTPTGLRKVLYIHWPLVFLVSAVSCIGFLMLYSVAGGDAGRWMEPQVERFALGMFALFFVALVPIWFWRNIAILAYLVAFALIVAVELIGETGGGAQRWIDLGFMRLQPSELMKIGVVLMLAAYYDWIPANKVSHPLYMIVPILLILMPVGLVIIQPDLGTALLIITGGAIMMFLAGVHWAYFAAVVSAGVGTIYAVFASRGTDWQLLKDYQYDRIDVFLDPSLDPLGDGYNITQAKIALGSGGWTGRGFMQGTQSQLNFLPEKHTDFIFTILAEEFGFIGSFGLLVLYALIIGFCVITAMTNKDRFSSLLTLGIAATFFLFFAINMAMVMGLAPVVGVPLPLVSYGGTAMLVLLLAFGLVQSAHVHKQR